jgi:hypothetical protein
MNELFIEINKFNIWAQTQQDDLEGEWEWERNYNDWDKIYASFENFIRLNDSKLWTKKEKEQLLYIISRNSETGDLSNLLNENEIIVLTEEAIIKGHRDAKWQLAIQLYKLTDRKLALNFLDILVNDDEEYVNRRSLMELAKLKSDTIHFYARLFWNRNKYDEMDQYQKIAVLYSLDTIDSEQLFDYIKMAKLDGRKYLVESALKIENNRKSL